MKEQEMNLLSFCIMAAIGCLDEPAIYGPMRLLEVMELVIEQSENPGRLLELRDCIHESKTLCLYGEGRFRESLQEIAFRLIALQ